MSIWLFIGMCLFLLGQIIRSVRWQILLPENARHKKHELLLYTSIGSLFNTVFPFRVGDLIRAILLSKGIKSVRFSTSLTSILIERMTDSIAILIAILLINYFYPAASLTFAAWMLLIPGVVFAAWALTSYSNRFKKVIYWASSFWNASIQISILDFFWTLTLQIKHKRFLSRHYISSTILMWGSYFSSYACFSLSFSSLLPIEIFKLFHSDNLNGALTTALENGYTPEVVIGLTLFLLLPILLAVIYSTLFKKNANILQSLNYFKNFPQNLSLSTFGLPSSFSGRGAYSNFLHSHFSGNVDLLSKIGVQGFEDCKISRVFHGGSGAITAIIEKPRGLSIRKVSNLSDAQKLIDQYNWLQSASNRGLPVTSVFNFINERNFCFYEMPYLLGTVDMHEWIHAVPIGQSKHALRNLIQVMSEYHSSNSIGESEDSWLNDYLNSKVIDNISLVKDAVSQLIDPFDFKINGEVFSISEWYFLENVDLLKSIIKDTTQTDIHGDLTIDNLIIHGDQNWMLIDPNPSTIYKSALMDWGKLLQSLHTGYEFLDRDTKTNFNQNSIKYTSYRSDRYHELFIFLLTELNIRYGDDGIQEAFLHEIIHYLRLLPYKFKVNDEKGLLFFAVTCKIIREFKDHYEIT
jgi:hypothetical protein